MHGGHPAEVGTQDAAAAMVAVPTLLLGQGDVCWQRQGSWVLPGTWRTCWTQQEAMCCVTPGTAKATPRPHGALRGAQRLEVRAVGDRHSEGPKAWAGGCRADAQVNGDIPPPAPSPPSPLHTSLEGDS